MPGCQSGAVHSVGCGTIIGIAVAGDFGVCHADCHEGECRKACTKWPAAVVRTPVSFRDKEAGAGWRNGMAKRIGCCRAARKGNELPQWAHW